MSERRHERERERLRRPFAERLEPRVLYSADAFGPFAPLLLDDDAETLRGARDVAALLDAFADGAVPDDEPPDAPGTFRVTETGDGVTAPASIVTFAELRSWEEADPGNRATLRDALLVAARDGGADRIELGPGVFVLDIAGSIEDSGRTGDLDIAGTLTLVGDGRGTTTLRMDTTDRVIDVGNGANLSLTGMTLTGGEKTDADENGGGIFVGEGATLTLDDVALVGNVATGDGGAIHVSDDATLTARDVVFSGNSAGDDGGAIHAADDATLTLDDVTLSGNSAGDDGGAIRVSDGATLVLTNVSVGGNVAAGGDGGGIAGEDGASLVLRNVDVTLNSAGDDGGGIHVGNGGSLSVLDSRVLDNTAEGKGGGIRADTLTIERSSVSDNDANVDSGGGIFAEGELNATDVLVQGNTSGKNGGGAHIHGGGTLVRVTFAGNEATSGEGGGLGVHDAGETTTIEASTFSGNEGLRGGGLHADGDVTVTRSTFHGNEDWNGGGALWVEGVHDVRVGGSAFEANRSNDGRASVSAGVTSLGYNVFSDDPPFPLAISDRENLAAGLGPLVSVGPYASVHRPGDGSPLIDAGGGAGPALDASGRAPDEIPDIGAVERPEAADVLYYVDGDRILRVGASLGDPQVVVSATGLSDVAVDIAGGRIYWLQNGGLVLGSSDLDGGDPAPPLSAAPSGGASAIAVDAAGGNLLVAFRDPLEIRRFELGNVTPPGELVVGAEDGLGEVADIAVSGTGPSGEPPRVFWADAGRTGVAGEPDVDKGIRSVRIDGTDEDPRLEDVPRALLDGVRFEALAVSTDGRTLYWTDSGWDDIAKDDLDAPGAVSRPTLPDTDPRGIAVDADGDRLYWSSDTGDSLVGVDTDLNSDRIAVTVDRDVVAIDIGRTSAASVPVVPNAAPVVQLPSGFTLPENGSRALQETGLSASDDVTPDAALVWTVVTAPEHGAIVRGGGTVTTFTEEQLSRGDVSYVHGGGEEASDAVTLRVDDGSASSPDVALAIGVTAVDDAPELTLLPADVREGVPFAPTVGEIAGRDAETPADALLYTIEGRPEHGTLSVDGDPLDDTFTAQDLTDGKLVYTHPFTGEAAHAHELRLSVADGTGGSDTGTLVLNVRPHNPDPPLGADDRIAVAEGAAASELVGGATSVLDNDTDPQGPADVLTVRVGDGPAHGDLTLAPDGTFTYAHRGGEAPDDRFTYVVSDGAGQSSAPVTVTIDVGAVNDPPGPVSLDRSDVPENAPGAAIGTLSVTDADAGDTVTPSVDDPRFVVTGRALALAPDTSLDHEREPRVPIVVTATDAAGATSTTTLTLDVVDVDDAPVARPDTAALVEGGDVDTLDGGDATVLGNDDAGAGDAVVSLLEAPRFGTLALDADGTFRYVHDGGEDRVDTFRYTVRDASGQVSEAATVTLVVEPVNDAPRGPVAPLSASAREGEPFAWRVDVGDWSDADPGDTLVPRIVRADGGEPPSWLTFDAASGLLSGTPTGADAGSLALLVEVRDGAGAAAAPLALTIDVARTGSAPVAVTIDRASVAENAPGAVVGRLALEGGEAGDPVRFAVDDARFVIDGDVLRLAPGTALDFERETLVETLVTATDRNGETRERAIAIAVLDGNDAPVSLTPPTRVTPDADGVHVVPATTFSDPDGDTLVYRASLADGGALPDWLAFDPVGLAFTVTPPATTDAGDGDTRDVAVVRLLADDGRGGTAFVELEFPRPPAPPAPAEPVQPPEPEPEPEPEPTVERAPAPVLAVVPPAAPNPASVPITDASTTATPVPDEPRPAEIADRVEVEIETVDLASLIGERPDIARLAPGGVVALLDEADERIAGLPSAPDIDTIDLASLLGGRDAASTRAFDGLASAFERERQALEERASFAQTLVGGSVGLTSGLSVGYLIWLIRGGALMGSVMSSLPAWRFVDPLPVLDGLADDADSDGESLESLVADDDGLAVSSPRPSADAGADTGAPPSTGPRP